MTDEVTIERARCPDTAHAKAVCKVGQGAATCRYLTMTSFGWSCEKSSSMSLYIDRRVQQGKMTASGNNCEGLAIRSGFGTALAGQG